jgi:hypothetical protein
MFGGTLNGFRMAQDGVRVAGVPWERTPCFQLINELAGGETSGIMPGRC